MAAASAWRPTSAWSIHVCGVSTAAAAATAKNYDGKDEGEKLELKESQTSEAAQKAVIYDSISIENVNSSSPW